MKEQLAQEHVGIRTLSLSASTKRSISYLRHLSMLCQKQKANSDGDLRNEDLHLSSIH